MVEVVEKSKKSAHDDERPLKKVGEIGGVRAGGKPDLDPNDDDKKKKGWKVWIIIGGLTQKYMHSKEKEFKSRYENGMEIACEDSDFDFGLRWRANEGANS